MRIDSALRRAQAVNSQNVAVEFERETATWSEFVERIQRSAGALREMGVHPGDRVAVLGHNSDTYLDLLYAIPWAGGIAVPINTRLAGPEMQHWLTDSSATALLCERALVEQAADVLAHCPEVRQIAAYGMGETVEGWPRWEELVARAQSVEAHVGPDTEPAAIYYTGGTTGRPKGVTLSHRNIMACAMQLMVELGWSASSTYLHAAPMFHIADGAGTYTSLLAGAKQTICRVFDPAAVAATIETAGVTCSLLVPTMIDLLIRDEAAAEADLSSLRSLGYGASPMPETVLQRLQHRVPNVVLYQFFGQTEASPVLTTLRPEYHVYDGPLAGKIRSAGHANTGCEVRVVDPDDNPLSPGEVGEIVGRGDNVMLGYWNQPEATATTLRNGWLHTGDAGYLDEDGFLYVVDRIKDMIVTGAENVYSAEVENALLLHSDIVEAQVIGIPDDRWGEAVHAVIRVVTDRRPSERDVISHCKRQIAAYKCPKSVEIRDEPFPMSGAGKYLKKELREPYWSGHVRRVN